MTDSVPPVPVASARRSLWDRVSIIWLIPLAALAIALGVAWQTVRDRGALIQIEFEDAAGVVARETELRYRDVTVGVVERVQFTAELAKVLVSVRVEPDIAPYIDADAQFWVVQPEITPQRIAGLETVLSGVYIEGSWDSVQGEPLERHQSLLSSPLLKAGQEGLEFTLRSTDGALTSTMPLIYKGVTVGQVGVPVIGEDGVSVSAPAVIFAPYDRLVTEATVFWDASGFSLNVGAAGAEVDFDSLSSLIVGGLAFETFLSGAQAAEDGDVFDAYLYEQDARDSIYTDPNSPTLELSAVFSGRFAGLAVGAPVELDGLRVGEVVTVNGVVDPDRFGDPETRLLVTLAVQPSRLGLEGEEGRDEIFRLLQERVAQGLRVRLATGSLLGGLKVEFVEVPGAPEAEIDLAALPFPALPITDPAITDIGGAATGLLERVDNLPVEQLLDSAIGLFDNASVLVGSAETQAIPGEITALLGDVRAVTGSPEVQALPADLSATLAEIQGTVEEVRAILAQVREQEAVTRVLAAVDSADAALRSIDTAAQGVPDLVARLSVLADKANALEVEPLLAEIQGLGADARALLQQPAVGALPSRLVEAADQATLALIDARAILADLSDGEVGARLASAIQAGEEAAVAVRDGAARIPDIAERIDALVAKAEGLPIEDLVTELTSLATSANAFVSSETTQALPADLSAALADVQAILQEAQDAELVANASAALQSARAAADTLPDLVARAGGLLDEAGVTLGGFQGSGELVAEAERAVREVAAAAAAVADLARAIERDPNSLIFGD